MITFRRAIWLGTLVVIAWLLTWPLVMNAWAASHWTQKECRTSVGDGYLFVVDDKVWVCDRRDFWQAGKRANRGVGTHIETPDSTCWVNLQDPREAVHFLDAPTNWSNATGRLIGAGLLLIAVSGMAFYDMRRSARNGRRTS